MAVCLSNLYTKVEIGHVLMVSMKLKEDPKRGEILLSNEIDEIKNIPLSINIIINNATEMEVKLSSHINGEKVVEECCSVKNWNNNDFISFYMLTLDDRFRIAFNDEHLCNFNYRCDIGHIKLVRVTGDVERVRQIDHRKVYPKSWPQNQETLPHIAFSSDVPCKFRENTMIVLRMTFTGNPNGSFFIRFNELGTRKQLFHFNPRFEEKIIVVNSMNDKLEWQSEFRCVNFPFVMNQCIQLAIFMNSSFFQVATNGTHLLKYPFKCAQSSGLRRSTSHPIYDKLTGFKIFALDGLKLNVSYVDIFSMKSDDSKFYELCSDMSYM